MQDLTSFIDSSPSPFHAVQTLKKRLEEAGFQQLFESDAWAMQPHRSYFTIRGGKTIVAWKCGALPIVNQGFRILVAHTDSPTIKVRPNPHIVSGNNRLLSVDVYGGPLLYTWLDRDLKLSGVVYTADKNTGGIKTSMVDLTDFPVRAPSLAIHLSRGLKDTGFKINPQTDLNLLFAQNGEDVALTLNDVLAEVCKVPAESIVSYDLRVADTQASGYIGADKSFISAPRLDNLFSCYGIMESLLAVSAQKLDQTEKAVWFDAEEIGSHTQTGARSNFLDSILLRIVCASPASGAEDFHRAKAHSAMLSVDMAHAEHPAFKDRTDENHVPFMNKGLALKHSSSANYGDSGTVAAWFLNACRSHDVPLQRFAYRCDHGGGSSLGSIVSLTGIRTIDVGAPMLSMHSIRELAGRKDVDLSIKAYNLFLNQPLIID